MPRSGIKFEIDMSLFASSRKWTFNLDLQRRNIPECDLKFFFQKRFFTPITRSSFQSRTDLDDNLHKKDIANETGRVYIGARLIGNWLNETN